MTKTVSPMLVTEVTTKKYIPMWFKRDFAVMSKEFNQARVRLKKKFDRCFACNRKFQIESDDTAGETMHIVHFNGLGNELVCTECLNKIFGEKSKLEHWSSEDDAA